MSERKRSGGKTLLRIVVSMIARFVVCLPLLCVAFVLDVSIIGLPLGIPLGLLLGKFMSKPMLSHRYFDPEEPARRLAKLEEEDAAKLAADPDWFVGRKVWN